MRRGTRAICGSLAMVVASWSCAGQAQAAGLLAVRPLRADDLRHPDFRRRLDLVAAGGRQVRARASRPRPARCWCSSPTGVMDKGHVAVVSQVLTDRVIQVTQANWSIIEGRRGQVERDVTVVDVSPAGDWSQVKVWYDPVRDLGKTVYPTYGFIYQTTQTAAARRRRDRRAHRRPDGDEPAGRRRADPGRQPGPGAHARRRAPPPTASPPSCRPRPARTAARAG